MRSQQITQAAEGHRGRIIRCLDHWSGDRRDGKSDGERRRDGANDCEFANKVTSQFFSTRQPSLEVSFTFRHGLRAPQEAFDQPSKGYQLVAVLRPKSDDLGDVGIRTYR